MKRVLKLLKRTMIILVSMIAIVAVIIFLYMQHPKFGGKPTGKRLERMQASPNYKDGSFVNHTYTPSLTEGYSMSKVMFDFLFRKGPGTAPKGSIPSVRTDLKNLPAGDWLLWF